MREVTFPDGDVLKVNGSSQALVALAGRQLVKDGIVIAAGAALHDSVEWMAEVARQCLVEWRTPAGENPLEKLSPKGARKVLLETPGIVDAVLTVAKAEEDQARERFKVDLGN